MAEVNYKIFNKFHFKRFSLFLILLSVILIMISDIFAVDCDPVKVLRVDPRCFMTNGKELYTQHDSVIYVWAEKAKLNIALYVTKTDYFRKEANSIYDTISVFSIKQNNLSESHAKFHGKGQC